MTVFITSPSHEMNLADANFRTFFSALGLDFDSNNLVGEFEPNEILSALVRFDPALAVRGEFRTANVIKCGLPLERVQRYVKRLREIALDAKKANKMVGYY